MKIKELEQHLSRLKGFSKPKIVFEQYATDAHLAARMLHVAATSFDDIEGRSVLDLGCGCGMLSIASMMLGSSFNVAVDIDPDALNIFRENMIETFGSDEQESDEEYEMPCLSMINADVTQPLFRPDYRFDTVLLNPPFGTKDKPGVDMIFLEKAISLASGAVYSMHKTSTREYILRRAKESWGVEDVQVIAQLKFDLPATYKFHKKDKVVIDVDLLRFGIA